MTGRRLLIMDYLWTPYIWICKKLVILCPIKDGFRNLRGCTLQLLKVLDDWTKAIDNGLLVDTLYLDLQKACDSVPHKRLIFKLERLGKTGNLLRWFKNFLSERKQRVVLNGISSNWTDVISGVLQGSVLGPILFILYVKDLPDKVKSY